MSRAGGDPLLITKVEVQADLQPMDAGLAQAKVKAQKAAAEIGAATAGGGAGAGGAVNNAANQAAAATKNLGDEIGRTEAKSRGLFATMRTGFAAVAGAIALVVLNMRRLVDLLADGETRSAAFIKTLQGTSDENAIRSVNEEINRLNDELRKFDSLDPFALWGAGFSRANIVDQIKNAESLAESIQNRINAKQIDTSKKRAEDLEGERKKLQQLLVEQLDGVEKIRAEEAIAIREVEDKRKDASEEAKVIYDQQRDAIVRNANLQIQKINAETESRRQAQADQERQAREAAERQAAALQQAYSSAIGRIQQEAIAAFSAERLTGAVETLLDRVEAIAEQRRNIRG